MHTFVLHIFPDSGLASSLITTVWIGVFVVCFFNLRFGWNLSGLIVPGYLVPLIIIKPWSSVAIVIEAVFTYFLIIFFSEFSSRMGKWSSLFGRDRFFAIILFSVVSRLLFDSVLFPELTVFLANYLDITFVYEGGLYSIGLVIVALLANQFWNPGIKRGFPQFLITIFVTFLIIRFVLLNYTNFRISEVAYLYEAIATSLAASPKAYIIFIVAAFLASRMNLLYGWEFGGIVLPALLALQWYYPWKIVSSILEAGIIYGLAVVILKTPLFKNITIEGARKILLFFNIAFVYKMLVGFLLPLIIPNVKILDVYGLGYMLTSLIAIKMYDKKIGLKMTRITLQTSLLAVILATIVGFFLLYIPDIPAFRGKAANKKNTSAHTHSKYQKFDDISEAVLTEQIRLYGFSKKQPELPLDQRTAFKNSIIALKSYAIQKSDRLLEYAKHQLTSLNYNLDIINDKYIMLYEQTWKRSRGIFIITLNPTNNITAEVPLSLQGPGLIENALLTVINHNFAALAIAGGKNTLPQQLRKYLTYDTSFYNIFCDIFESMPTVQFFRQDEYMKDLLKKQYKEDKTKRTDPKAVTTSKNYVYYSKKLPPKYLKTVSAFYPKLEQLEGRPSFIRNDENIISLFLSPKTELDILTSYGKFNLEVKNSIRKKSIASLLSRKKGFLDSTLSSFTNLFKSSPVKEKNKPLTIAKARYIDTQILTPIINLTGEYSELSKEEREARLKLITFASKIVGCTVSTVTWESVNRTFILLSSFKDSTSGYLGGTYIFNLGETDPYIVEIINPSNKNNLELGTYLTVYLKARACFVSGSFTQSDYFSYLDDQPTVRSLFNLVNQVMIRENDFPKPETADNKEYRSTVVQISSLPQPAPDSTVKYSPDSIFFTTYYGKYNISQLNIQELNIYNFLKSCNLKILFDDKSPKTTGLAAIHSLQARYLPETANTDFILLLTPDTKFNKNTFSTKKTKIKTTVQKDSKTDKITKKANQQQSKKL